MWPDDDSQSFGGLDPWPPKGRSVLPVFFTRLPVGKTPAQCDTARFNVVVGSIPPEICLTHFHPGQTRPAWLRQAQLAGVLLTVLILLAGALLWLPPKAPLPIRVGVVHALTGSMATSEQPLVDAVRLAVEELNAQGGLLGRPIELLVADSASNWGQAAAEAQRLISTEKVSVLFACWTSACRKAVKPVVEQHGHLMFYAVQYEGLEQSPNIIYTGAAPNQQVIPGAHWAMTNLGRRIYLVGSDYVFPRAANMLIKDVAASAAGVVLAEHYFPLGHSNFDALVQDMERLHPDVILNTLNGDSNLHFLKALKARTNTMPMVSFSLSESELHAMGPAVFHPYHYAVWSYFQNLATPANLRFVAAYRARYGADRVTSDPVEASYNNVMLWANAVRESSTADPLRVNQAMGRQSLAGPSGIVAVDAATRHVWRTVNIGVARPDGQFDPVQSATELVRPTPWPGYRSRSEWQALLAALLDDAATASAVPHVVVTVAAP